MKKEDIFQAIGELDSDFLEQCETPRHKAHNFWMILFAAVLILALGITAGAGGFGRITQGDATEVTVTHHISSGIYEIKYESNELQVFVDLELNSSAPTTLRTVYLPQLCQDFEVTGLMRGESVGYSFNGMTSFEISWDHPDWQFLNNITFAQRSASWWAETEKTDTPIDYLSGTPVETKMLRWDNREAFLVTVGPSKNDLSQFHRLYWTDGDYVFILRCPYGFGEEWMTAAIESLAPAEDLDKIQEELSRRTEKSSKDIWEDLLQVANSSPEVFTKQFRPASGHLEILESGRPKLHLDEVAAPDAPEKVEMLIFPAVALEKDYTYHTNCIPTMVDAPEGVQKGVADYFAVNWYHEEGGLVEFWQIAHNSSYADFTSAVGGAAEEVQLSQVTIGDYTLLQFIGQDVPSEQLTGKALYWMDDDYRYILTCPLSMTDAEILEFLDSLDRLK